MLKLVEELKIVIASSVKATYGVDLDVSQVTIETPQNEDFGDYATNVSLVLAKELRKSPIEIAQTLAQHIETSDVAAGHLHGKISKVEGIVPGFINFHLSPDFLLNLMAQVVLQNITFGSTNLGNNKHIALEHSNVNPNKAPHVGHLRNAVIGQFLEKIHEFLGYDVSVQYYSNDVGVQVATSFLGSKHINKYNPNEYERFDYYAWDIYAEISSILLQKQDLKTELENLLKQIEDPNLEISSQVAAFADKILSEQVETFNKLGITYDVIIHERDIIYTQMWETCFEIMKQNSNFYLATQGKSAGCWLLKNLSEANSQNNEFEKDKIIVRSNGVPTYTGKDIAYHMFKYGLLGKDFGYNTIQIGTQSKTIYETNSSPSKDQQLSFSNAAIVIDVIDQKQTYAINAVKEALKVLGYEEEASNMHHVNYGFVYLSPKTANMLGLDTSDGAAKYEMSGRKGLGIKILDFILMVDEKINKEYGEFEAKDSVRNAAIKFELLKYNTFNDIIFDLDTALNTKGFSGPYLQYTHARIASVLSKSNQTNLKEAEFDKIHDPQAQDLLRVISKFDEVVVRSATEFAPNLLCEYLFRIAKEFNSYYNDHSILGAETQQLKSFRLNVALCTKIVISNGLSLLGIDAPEKI